MAKARNQWHPSHERTTPPPLPNRTREAIAARNRAWGDIAAALGLPAGRMMDSNGRHREVSR